MYQVLEEETSGYNELPKGRDYFTTKSKTFRIPQGKNMLRKSAKSQVNQESKVVSTYIFTLPNNSQNFFETMKIKL